MKKKADQAINSSFDKLIEFITAHKKQALALNQSKYEKLIAPSLSMIETIQLFQDQLTQSQEVFSEHSKDNTLEKLLCDLKRMDEDQV